MRWEPGKEKWKPEVRWAVLFVVAWNWFFLSTSVLWRTLYYIFQVMDLLCSLISGYGNQILGSQSMQKMRNKWSKEHLDVRCTWWEREKNGGCPRLLWFQAMACCFFWVRSKKLPVEDSKCYLRSAYPHFLEAAAGFWPSAGLSALGNSFKVLFTHELLGWCLPSLFPPLPSQAALQTILPSSLLPGVRSY